MAIQGTPTRDQALDARPVRAEIHERVPLPDGGARISVAFRTSKWQRWLLRLPERITRDFELDAFGVEILDMCDGSITVRGMIDAFATRHKVTAPEAELAIVTFLRTLVSKGVVSLAMPKDR